MSRREYVWLGRLRKDLKLKEDIEPLMNAYRRNSNDPLYQAVMDIIIRANPEQYEEGRKMCDALRELFAGELAEREELGRMRLLLSQVRKKQMKGMRTEEIADVLEEDVELVRKLFLAIEEHPECTDEEIAGLLQKE